MPNYHKETTLKKLLICFLVCLIFLSLSLYLIDWWLAAVSDTINLKESIIGIFFLGIGLQSSFLTYNLKFVKKDSESSEFYQTFIQLAIFKKSFCIGGSWLIDCLGNG
jgi:Ca2+/Na+ antiporter